MVDLQALVGDPVDNVPGVPGIGIKTAAKLLQEFGTLENILANIDKVSGAKWQENLRAFAEKVQVSRRLVRLATDVPIALDWDAWKLRNLRHASGCWSCSANGAFDRFADQVRAIARKPQSSDAGRHRSARRFGRARTAPSVQGELFPFRSQRRRAMASRLPSG